MVGEELIDLRGETPLPSGEGPDERLGWELRANPTAGVMPPLAQRPPVRNESSLGVLVCRRDRVFATACAVAASRTSSSSRDGQGTVMSFGHLGAINHFPGHCPTSFSSHAGIGSRWLFNCLA